MKESNPKPLEEVNSDDCSKKSTEDINIYPIVQEKQPINTYAIPVLSPSPADQHYQMGYPVPPNNPRASRYGDPQYNSDLNMPEMPLGNYYSAGIQMKNDRRAFIRKVYSLLSIQLIWTVAVAAIVVCVPVVQRGIQSTKPLIIAALVICLALVLAIMCFKKIARQYPINYLALFLFSFFESYIVAYVCSYYDPIIVLCAALITMCVAFSLTIYAWKTKHDFTVCGGALVSVSTSMVLFGFFMIFFNTHYVNLIFCELAIVLYSVFIVYDTQLIAGGRYAEISYDDYVIGALILYVDIVGLFLYILSIFGAKS